MMRRITILLLLCTLFVPIGCRDESESDDAEEPIVTHSALPQAVWGRLQEAGWSQRVGDHLGLWVSVARQRLIGIQQNKVRFVLVCSTAARGTGNRENSHQTPLGWHEIAERYGDGLPAGIIFRERKNTGRIWRPDNKTTKDYILSRILWLRGLQPGVNQGRGIDSHERFIYIHGTPAEEQLGTPASMGCIRLSISDVIQLFDQTQTGTSVLISEW